MDTKHEDPAMGKVRSLFEKSGLSLHDFGLKMGYPAETARQAVFQFLKAGDPRISMLRKFASAMDVPISVLIEGGEYARDSRTKGRTHKKATAGRKKGRADSQA